ncbi:MAG: phage tail family protein [Eubacteriales bacterium]|nr:phage tail family protein [Eubacteriales bacterium]
MIKKIVITNYLGNSLELDLSRPEKSGFAIKSIDGLGPAKGNVNMTEISTNDGSQFNSARLSNRNLVFNLMFVETDTETIEDIRQKSYRYFPVKKRLTITVKTDNRTLETSGYVESNEPDIFSETEGCQISIVCGNPYFYSAGEDGTNETDFYGVTPAFEFPFSNESLVEPLLEMGIIEIRSENVVTYEGDADIGITITIHAVGEATNITIYNIGTREEMFIDTEKFAAIVGSGIQFGDDIIITTIRGEKGIVLLRDGVTTNILNCLGKGSTWFSLTKGDNLFAYTAETGGINLQFKIVNRVIYEGV